MTVRRSTRSKSKASYADSSDAESDSEPDTGRGNQRLESVVADEGADNNKTTAIEYDELMSESSSSEGEDAANDEDYIAPGSKKRPKSRRSKTNKNKRARGTSGSSSSQKASSHGTTKKDQESYFSMRNEFDPTELFYILATSIDASIEEVVNDWLDSYSQDRNRALAELVNFLLDCAGCLTHIGDHDVANNDSSNETIGEIQIMFQEQKLHEFHLLLSTSRSKRCKYGEVLDVNFNDFFQSLMKLIYDKELIYTTTAKDSSKEIVVETSMLMIDLFTWIPSMSVSKIRSLRYVSTRAMYQFQNVLSSCCNELENETLFKLRKQLTMERKKKRSNASTVKSLEASITDAEATKTVLEKNIDNVIKLCLVHRFKDVDETIRILSLQTLSNDIQTYPEYFFKVTFLKYFGWLLSDCNQSVRLLVVNTLKDLIRFSNKRNQNLTDSAALRQFFERFKDRVLEIAHKDVDIQVRISAVQVLSHINDFGYLDDDEILSVTSLIFSDQEVKITSASRDVKFLNEVSKFFFSVATEKAAEFLDNNQESLAGLTPSIDKSMFVKTGVLMRILSDSLSRYKASTENHEQVTNSFKNLELLAQAAEFLAPRFSHSIITIAKLLYKDERLDEYGKGTSETSVSSSPGVELLLPVTDNNIEFYVIVLRGLCEGASLRNKGHGNQFATEAIIPELAELFEKVNIDSDVIYSQLLHVVQLFSSEDWSQRNNNDHLNVINEKILKHFESSAMLFSKADPVVMTYRNLIPYLVSLNSSKIVNSWKSLLVNIQVSLGKFLETFKMGNRGSITTLYAQYLNKMTLLGKQFQVELSDSIVEALIEKLVSPLSNELASLDEDALSVIDMRLFTSLISWNLESWSKILDENEEPTPISHSTLSRILSIINTFTQTANQISSNSVADNKAKYHVLYAIVSPLLDSIIAFKMFELSVSKKDSSWQLALRTDYHVELDQQLANLLLTVFLYLESCQANAINATLERVAEEDVNLTEAKLLEGEDPERELCLFTLKLKGLFKLGVLHYTDLQTRLAMNSEVLGPLFKSIVNDSIFEEESKYRNRGTGKASRQSIPETKRLNMNESLEPIEEFTQDEAFHSPSQNPDPIMSSP